MVIGNKSQERTSIIVLSLFVLSMLITFSMKLLSSMTSQDVFEFFKGFILFINLWGLGSIVSGILFTTDLKDNDAESTETGSNSRQNIFRFLLLPIALGMIAIVFFGLFAIIVFNMSKVSDVTQRSSTIFVFFYLSEFFLVVTFLLLNHKIVTYLLKQLKVFMKQPKSLGTVKKLLPSGNFLKESHLILMSFFSVTILIISMILGEINYNFETINITLVYLFFIAIILLLFFYFQSKNRTDSLDMILIFLLAFSLAHLFISRGPMIVGRTDIHNEFFFAKNTLETMNWDPNEFEENYNTIVSISVFPMVLNVIFGITRETFFELVNPIIFGLLNIVNYLILKRIYAKYRYPSCTKSQKLPEATPHAIMFSILLVIFIRSYTHIIAASTRIIIAYFIFNMFCLIIIDDKLLSGLKRVPILFFLLTFVFLSHWGTFLFGVAVIITSFIIFFFYLSLKKYNLLMNFSTLITREKVKKIFMNGVFVGAFGFLAIIWFFFIAPQVMNFLQQSIIPAVEDSLNEGIDNLVPQVISLFITYRMINLSSPLIFFETSLNLLIGLIIIVSNLSKFIRIFQLETVHLSDFFGVASFLVMGLMFLIPILSSFYSPLRIGMQFWPFISPIFVLRINFNRKISFRFHFPSFLKKVFSIKMSSVMSIFLFLLIIFHQGLIYDIAYSGYNSASIEVLEVGESLSLVFRNYGVEAWRWVLTESDLQAIQWLDLQSPFLIYADRSRTSMLLSRINRTTIKDTRVIVTYSQLHHFFMTNNTNHIQRNSYIFFSSQNIESGAMFFSDKPSNTYRLISQLIELNAFLVYSNKTQIYYLPYQ